MLRTIIIDDIHTIRQKNIAIIKEYCPEVAVIAEADSVQGGIAAIRQYHPDLIFLDVEMADGSGFDLLEQLSPVNFKVIFITAHESFALKAFRACAVDFLLKPIDPADLMDAVRKATETISKEMLELQFNTLLSNMARPKKMQKLILKTTEKIHSVSVQDIIRCESEKNYTTFHTASGEKLLVSTTLKEYETVLTPLGFYRTHQSHLINIAFFDHYVKGDAGTIVLKDKSSVPLAVRKKEEFFALLDAL